MNQTSLEARPRRIFRKKSRFLRRAGITPANLYGPGLDSVPLQVDTASLRHVLATTSRNTLVQLRVLGEPRERTAFIWQVQRHPLTEDIVHVDLYQVEATRRMRAEVPLVLEGVDPELARFGKEVVQYVFSVEVESLPADLPTDFRVDGSRLKEIDDAIILGDIPIGEAVQLLTDRELIVARMVPIVGQAEEEAAPEEGAEAAGGEPPEEPPA